MINTMTHITPLCELGKKYLTDKSPLVKHAYTPFYYDLLKEKQHTIKKVLEIGIGYEKTESHTKSGYRAGASLRMWRDFFSNAQIYGADIQPRAMVQDTRIQTFICDEKDELAIHSLLIQTGRDIDLVIDDASHFWRNQVFLAKTILPLLPKDVIYIIEDVSRTQYVKNKLFDEHGYVSYIPHLIESKHKDSNLIVVFNKK